VSGFLSSSSDADRSSRDSDSSSTSSCSPPLGATSLLAALASPIPQTVPLPRYRSATSPHTPPEDGVSHHRIGSAPSLHHQQAPGSPRSVRSLSSSTSSNALTSSRSFPRLHQPTVVRKPSGRLSFLPPPAQISPSGSLFAINQPGRRRSESTRSEGYGSMESISRLNAGSLDNLGRYNYGSMESLGSVVDRSSGELRGAGFPPQPNSTDSLGLARMEFGSMESLGRVMDRGDNRALGGGRMGSSVESLNRVLAGSTPVKAGQSRENLLSKVDMGDIAEQISQVGVEDVMENGVTEVSHGSELAEEEDADEAIRYGRGPGPGWLETQAADAEDGGINQSGAMSGMDDLPRVSGDLASEGKASTDANGLSHVAPGLASPVTTTIGTLPFPARSPPSAPLNTYPNPARRMNRPEILETEAVQIIGPRLNGTLSEASQAGGEAESSKTSHIADQPQPVLRPPTASAFQEDIPTEIDREISMFRQDATGTPDDAVPDGDSQDRTDATVGVSGAVEEHVSEELSAEERPSDYTRGSPEGGIEEGDGLNEVPDDDKVSHSQEAQ